MRVSTILPAALAVAPLATATLGRLGFALGARKEPCEYSVIVSSDSTKLMSIVVQQCKTQADYEADFDTLTSYTTIVRTYSAVDGAVAGKPCYVLPAILPAARNKGVSVIVGLW